MLTALSDAIPFARTADEPQATANIMIEAHVHELEAEVTKSVEQLRESEERLRTVLGAAPVILFATNAAGVFTFSEGKGLEAVGLSPGERVGQSFIESYAKFPQIMDNFQRALSGETTGGEITLGNRTFDVRLAPSRKLDGTITGVTGVSLDVTAAKRTRDELLAAKEEAEYASNVKSEFLSRMSHELRTPLNSILGFSQLLQMQANGAMEEDSIDQIVTAGKRLLSLIDDVLDISRVETGQLRLDVVPLCVYEMVQGALKPLQTMATARGIRLELGECRPAVHVLADRLRLHQALLNLLSNAIKFSPENAVVHVSCEQRAGWVRVSISDTGPGVNEANLSKLFVPFERLDANRRCIDGTGVGLALSKRLIESQGGRIGVESRLEEGSTFWVELPFTEREPTSAFSCVPDSSGHVT